MNLGRAMTLRGLEEFRAIGDYAKLSIQMPPQWGHVAILKLIIYQALSYQQ